jgi:glycosyltransferase involved in cell wall biosynthesis
MKIGLFGARADDRGLGRISHDFYTRIRPDRTVVIDMGIHAHGFTQHLDRYPDTVIVPFNGGRLDDTMMRRFFTGLDVAVIYETAYDHRAYDIARTAGCRTVLMTMPEFHRHATETLPQPDVVWAPTTWRLDTLPSDTRVVPVPVAIDPVVSHRRPDGLLRVLHVAGHRTSGDRNGTIAFLRAIRALNRAVAVRVVSQDRRLPNVQLPRRMPITVELGGIDDYRRLYHDADVLVMPRRYGGLCLPVQEALGAGLGVVMTDCEPNPATWPIAPVGGTAGTTIRTPGGPVTLYDPDPAAITETIERLAAAPAEVDALKARARTWAAANSWETLTRLYRAELERAVSPPVMVA